MSDPSPSSTVPARRAGQLRICLIQRTSVAIVRATETWSELCTLALEAGHQVTRATPDETGIEFVVMDGADQHVSRAVPFGSNRLIGAQPTRVAYQTYLWLAREAFDVVYAPAEGGTLFYALLARSQGLDLQATRFVLSAGRLTVLGRAQAGEMPAEIDDLVRDEMERRTIALADLITFPDEETENWIRGRGWHMGGRALRLPVQGDALMSLLCEGERVQPPLGVTRADDDAAPLVSVCIPHFNRFPLLRQAIESIRRQDYPSIDLIVVDDASSEPEAAASLDAIAAELAGAGGRLIRHTTNQYLGAARNTAVRHARGEYVMFLDDDDYAKPDQVSTLVRVARRTGADIVNSLCDRLVSPNPPPLEQPEEERWLALGNAPAVGLFVNLFGPAAALFRKAAFEALGGFTTLHGIGNEDWEIFARASLAGMNHQIVPRALFWYRLTPNSMVQTACSHAGNMRALTPYLAQVPAALRPAMCFAQRAGQQVAGATWRVEQIEKLLSSSFAQIEDLHRHIAAQGAELASAHTHVRELQTALDSAHVHLRARLDALETAQQQSIQMDEHCRRLEEDLATLRRDNTTLTSRAAALAGEEEELRSVRAIVFGGYGTTPQSAVDAIWRSRTWRAGRLLRSFLAHGRFPAADTAPAVGRWAEAAAVLVAVHQSTWWELTGPLRAACRILRRRVVRRG